jgi:predicted nucleic acid-binding protein
VWIEVFRRDPRITFDAIGDFDDVVTCLPVVQEVLQGFRDENAFRAAREAFLALPIVESPMGSGVFAQAIDLYRSARRQGVTVRSSIDCLIAVCARGTVSPSFIVIATSTA